jgi:hypothetical protein
VTYEVKIAVLAIQNTWQKGWVASAPATQAGHCCGPSNSVAERVAQGEWHGRHSSRQADQGLAVKVVT